VHAHAPGRAPAPRAGLSRAAACLLALVALAGPASAQQALLIDTGFDDCKQAKWERVDANHYKLVGGVECRRGDMAVFADLLELFTDTHRGVAVGNVTFRQADMQISADRADFNYETRLGVFTNAYGFATLADQPTRSPMGGQEPDVYFYGRTIEKIGDDKYKITKGGFTTCVQPTPRWQITSGTVTFRLDHYAFMKNALLKAKSIPVFYFPALFYPIKKDDRATGFLMPAYGTSTYRGFTLSNAFFWAIDRSQDATFFYDWFSKRGQGAGAEYRFVSAPGSNGYLRFYRLDERATDTTPATQSYEIRSNVTQTLGRGWVARARVDYFTNITVNQAYNTNIYDASRSTRTYSGALSGRVAEFTLNASYDRTEYFSGTTDTTLTGGTPRLSFSRGERPLFGSPVYFSLNGEFVNLTRVTSQSDVVTDRSLGRFDIMPTFRLPFTKLRFLTVNTSAAFRETYWTRSQNPNNINVVLDEPVNRTYFDVQARVTGPVVNKVWNTPGNGYAEKWKHTIEPNVVVQRVTMVDNFDRIVQLDPTDYILGGTTRVNYGVASRVLAKRRSGQGFSAPREFLVFNLTQSYYTDARASQYDYNYTTSFGGRPPSNFSPIQFAMRASPSDQINGALRVEYDHQAKVVQSIAADGQVGLSEWFRVGAGYSRRRTPNAFATTPQLDNFLNANTTLRSPGNRVGGGYNFNFDIGRSVLLNSRIVAYYNAQCCGFAVEYQTYNFPPGNPAFPTGKDRRFNFSFTLAGLGTFSNFFGALGGGQR
jgi:LPS-assembly protein